MQPRLCLPSLTQCSPLQNVKILQSNAHKFKMCLFKTQETPSNNSLFTKTCQAILNQPTKYILIFHSAILTIRKPFQMLFNLWSKQKLKDPSQMLRKSMTKLRLKKQKVCVLKLSQTWVGCLLHSKTLKKISAARIWLRI